MEIIYYSKLGCSGMRLKLIDLFETDTLRSRNAARYVLKLVLEVPLSEKITIDFSGITFASRSFCNELLIGLRKTRKNVKLANVSKDVKKMMDASLKKPKIDFNFVVRDIELKI